MNGFQKVTKIYNTGIYEGEFYNNKPKGQGTINFNDENKYSGLWKDGFNGKLISHVSTPPFPFIPDN